MQPRIDRDWRFPFSKPKIPRAKQEFFITKQMPHRQTRWTIASPTGGMGEGVTQVLNFGDPNVANPPPHPLDRQLSYRLGEGVAQVSYLLNVK
jgi:hypothetical protein